jgi:polynucleotide 5'-hydroxyl-kinase GRC3/NOL9
VLYYVTVNEIQTSPAWERLGDQDLRGTILIIGDSDTGKSTLARYLFQRLAQRGHLAAYLDLDMGQSSLGLPTTLNLGLAAGAGDDVFPPRGKRLAFFVGATSPRGHMLPAVVGAYRLREEGRRLGADIVVVDTTGLVDRAQGGRALKQWKIELLAPSLVVGLQGYRELEPILWPLRRDGRVRTVELPVSPHVRQRSREARIAHRRERLMAYFRRGRRHEVNLKTVAAYDLERLAHGTLLAFQDAEGFVLELGVVLEAGRPAGWAVVHSPLNDLDHAASLRLGTLRWDLGGRREL